MDADFVFKPYWRSLSKAEREALAVGIGTTVFRLKNVAARQVELGIKQCVALELYTGGRVPRNTMRADWREIWPELASRAPADTTQERQAA